MARFTYPPTTEEVQADALSRIADQLNIANLIALRAQSPVGSESREHLTDLIEKGLGL